MANIRSNKKLSVYRKVSGTKERGRLPDVNAAMIGCRLWGWSHSSARYRLASAACSPCRWLASLFQASCI